jgi:hypothetical protein
MGLLQKQGDVVSCKYLWREKFADRVAAPGRADHEDERMALRLQHAGHRHW